jgi:hypothetical protein
VIKELLKRAIEQKNPFMTKDMVALQIEFFFAAGKLTSEDHAELTAMLNQPEPPAVEPEVVDGGAE